MEGCIGTLLRGGRGVVPKNHRGFVNASIIIIIPDTTKGYLVVTLTTEGTLQDILRA